MARTLLPFFMIASGLGLLACGGETEASEGDAPVIPTEAEAAEQAAQAINESNVDEELERTLQEMEALEAEVSGG